MAKKRKKRSTKHDVARTGSPFWRQVFAVILVVAAVFMLLGSLEWGGPLPVKLFEIAAWFFGFAAFFVPVVLVYLAILKLKDDEYLIPFSKLLGSVIMLSMTAGVLHVFVDRSTSLSAARAGDYGGMAGHLLSGVFLNFLNDVTAFILFSVLMFVAFLFTSGIAPARIFTGIVALFRRSSDEQPELASLKVKADESGFRLHEGVPVEHVSEKQAGTPRISSLKNTAQKLTPSENHQALTTASDPDWTFPNTDLLNQKQDKADAGDIKENARIITETLNNFNIPVEVEGANVGPRVTQFTLKPPAGIKLSKITALESNISLDLAAHSIRMEAPIPGKRAVGIEVPNVKPATVRAASVLASREWSELSSPLGIAIGKDIAGNSVVASLDKMPHLLVAGQTGSGKSVMINLLLTSLLYRNSPSDLKLILVDPKQVELAPYNDIPHLLTEVIVEPEKCISALKWAVAEMERRYRKLADSKYRSITEYNASQPEEGMPYIVIVIDEMADLMMMAARDVESLIVRIAQKARAVGIHLVLATQRPSVDVITGLIKANIPARIAFTVASQVDSRTIIDSAGAEKLLGMGDMLFSTADMPRPKRVQGALITGEETQKLTDFLRMQRAPDYNDEVVSLPVQLNGRGGVVADMSTDDDPAFKDAIRVVVETRKASTSLLQRRLGIGYGKAARFMDIMEERGIVSAGNGNKPREVLISSLDDTGGSRQTIPVETGDEVYDDMSDD